MVLQPKDGIGIISHSAMKTLIGSCADQVPELLDRYRPDGMLSVATKPKLTPSLPTGRHLSLRFADIDRPAPRNRSLAAKPDDIDAIRSLSDCDRLLMHCRQGAAPISQNAIDRVKRRVFQMQRRLRGEALYPRTLCRMQRMDLFFPEYFATNFQNSPTLLSASLATLPLSSRRVWNIVDRRVKGTRRLRDDWQFPGAKRMQVESGLGDNLRPKPEVAACPNRCAVLTTPV
jgi:hypothetical protein